MNIFHNLFFIFGGFWGRICWIQRYVCIATERGPSHKDVKASTCSGLLTLVRGPSHKDVKASTCSGLLTLVRGPSHKDVKASTCSGLSTLVWGPSHKDDLYGYPSPNPTRVICDEWWEIHLAWKTIHNAFSRILYTSRQVNHAKCIAQSCRSWKPCEMDLSHNCSQHGVKSEVCEKQKPTCSWLLTLVRGPSCLGRPSS